MSAGDNLPPEWVKHAVFYQIFPDRFARSKHAREAPNLEPWDSPPTLNGFKGGDLYGVVERLDYLQDLGITALYFNPVFQSASNHRYHTCDYYRIDPLLGGDKAFQLLLDEAHARSMRVILDGVFNHAGRGLFQFHHILENGPESPYMNWFHIKGFPLRAYRKTKNPNYEAWANLPALPKFNTEDGEVREFLISVGRHWIKRGIDGWRLDVPLEIKTPGFWEDFRSEVKEQNPEAYLVAELWGEAASYLGGHPFDAAMNYVFKRACLGFFGGRDVDTSFRPGGFKLERKSGEEFQRELSASMESVDRETALAQFNLLGSHDTPRFLTVLRGRKERLKPAVLFQMTFPGAPCVYYGDEVGMEGGRDPDCRRGFPGEEGDWDKDLLNWFKSCIRLRHKYEALRAGEYIPLNAGSQVVSFGRRSGKETLVVVFNAGTGGKKVSVPVSGLLKDGTLLEDCFGSSVYEVKEGAFKLSMKPLEGKVLVKQR